MSSIGLLVLSGALVVLVAAFQTGASLVFVASGAALGSLALALLLVWGKGRGSWRIEGPGHWLGPAGEEGEALWRLVGPPGRQGYLLWAKGDGAPSRPPRLWWQLPGPDWAIQAFTLGPEGFAHLSLASPSAPRSARPAPTLWRLSLDPWGFWPWVWPLPQEPQGLWHRHPPGRPPEALPWLDRWAMAGSHQAHPWQRGGGASLRGIRPHAPGDPLRWVHWRSTARQGGRWQVKEQEGERSPELWLALDLAKEAHDPLSFEAMAELAGGLWRYAEARGWRCGLVLEGAAPLEGLEAVLSALAVARPIPGAPRPSGGPGWVVVGPRPPAEAGGWWVATPPALAPRPEGAEAIAQGPTWAEAWVRHA